MTGPNDKPTLADIFDERMGIIDGTTVNEATGLPAIETPGYVIVPVDLPSPADDGASDEDKASEPGWHRRQREDDKAEKADQDDDERRIGS